MHSYQVALFIHILAAIAWLGGAIAVQAFAIRTIGRGDALEIARFSSDAEKIGMRLFMPASLVVVLAGAWMIHDGPWTMADGWVSAGLGLYVLSFLTGMAFLGPEAGRISKLTDQHGAEHPDVQRRIRRVLLVSRIELVWLIAIVALMVFKP